MIVFRKICGALFSCYFRFKIRPFALSLTILGAHYNPLFVEAAIFGVYLNRCSFNPQ